MKCGAAVARPSGVTGETGGSSAATAAVNRLSVAAKPCITVTSTKIKGN